MCERTPCQAGFGGLECGLQDPKFGRLPSDLFDVTSVAPVQRAKTGFETAEGSLQGQTTKGSSAEVVRVEVSNPHLEFGDCAMSRADSTPHHERNTSRIVHNRVIGADLHREASVAHVHQMLEADG
eukprot:2763394-Rhodomonas_salina.1